MKLIFRLLPILFLLATACNADTAPQTAPSLVADNWQGVQIQTLCLEVQQAYPEIETKFSLPIEPAVERILKRLGIKTVSPTEVCDATLTLNLQGYALAEDYVCILGNACGHCFSGSWIYGELTLTSPNRASYDNAISGRLGPPGSITECAKTESSAPYAYAWTRAVLSGLVDLWGSPILASALEDKDMDVQLAAVDQLKAKGTNSIPTLISALESKAPEVRIRAANALGSMGAEAQTTIPALIEMVGSDDRQTRMAAAGALHLITGEEFGQYQESWEAWLANSQIEPTPFTSWKDIPIYEGSLSPEELGNLLIYRIDSSCTSVISYYQSQMPVAGWEYLEKRDFPNSTKLTYQKDTYQAELTFTNQLLIENQPKCTIQIMRLEKR